MDRTTYVNQLHARHSVAYPVIAELVECAADRPIASVERILSGDEYEVHRARLTDEKVVYLRVTWPGTPPGKVHHEVSAMEQARAGGVPVPEVLAVQSIESDQGERTAMVVAEAAGRQLKHVIPSLSAERRSQVMAEIGRTLAILHAVQMPGPGVPQDDGRWPDYQTERRRYLDRVLADTRYLGPAGVPTAEVARVINILERSLPESVEEDTVLCHGDVSPEHIFVDHDLHVVGLIDWGMWHSGPTASELAGMAMRTRKADLDDIISGHGLTVGADLSRDICWHTIAHATGQIRWLVSSDQAEELDRPVAALREALAMITD